ncbi:MAG TPA: PQQ-binding-like beta-propeller repeat protein, partial [Kofleriaceae bacterium]
RAEGCASHSVIVAAAGGDNRRRLSYRIDGEGATELSFRGGWDYAAPLPELGPGPHQLEIIDGTVVALSQPFTACRPPSTRVTGDWPQAGGSAEHQNAIAQRLHGPLESRWATSVGGRPAGLAVRGDTVVVASDAPSAGSRVLALSLSSGDILWSHQLDVLLVGPPALTGDRALVTSKNGDVLAFSLQTGVELWSYAASARSTFDATTWSAPTVLDGTAYVAMEGQLVALSTDDGHSPWSFVPDDPEFHWLASLASPAAIGQLVISVFDRTAGLVAMQPSTDTRVWNLDDDDVGVTSASPVISDGLVYLLSTAGVLTARRIQDGSLVFTRSLTPGLTDWDYSTVSTPAIGNGRIFVATQRDFLYALDARSGQELWKVHGAPGSISTAHYSSAPSGWPASPLFTGDTVWIGSLDGTLDGFDAATGERRWHVALGAPVTTGLVPVSDGLLVATYDGTIHLLTTAR